MPCSLIVVDRLEDPLDEDRREPSDGSSSSSSLGRAISARPIAHICCSPPDIVPAFWRSRSCKRGNRSKTRSMSSRIPSRSGAGTRPSRGSRGTVIRGKQPASLRGLGDPAPTISCAGHRVMSRPCERIEPCRGRFRPLIERSVVDLPAPLAPSSVTISPSRTCQRDALERVDRAVVGVDVVDLEDRGRGTGRGHDRPCRFMSSTAALPRYASITRSFCCTSRGVPSAIFSP